MFLLKLPVLVVVLVTYQFVTSEDLSFETSEDFFVFYKNWSKTKDADGFLSIQTKIMEQILDPTVDPCDNFYKFACGNFGTFLPKNFSWFSSSMDHILYEGQKFLVKDLVASEVTGEENEEDLQLKVLYRSCVDDAAWNFTALGDFVKNFASWPMLNESWSEEEFDWLNVTAQASLYDLHLLFKHSIETHQNVYQHNFGIEWNSENRVRSVKDIATKLSIKLTGENGQLLEVFNFADTFLKLFNTPPTVPSRELYNISDLHDLTPHIDLVRFLEIISRSDKTTPFHPVTVFRPEFFRALSELLADTDVRTIANYLLVDLILSAHEETVRTTDALAYMREDSCSHFIKENVKTALENSYVRQYFNEGDYLKSSALVNKILYESRKRIEETQWPGDSGKMRVLSKFNAIDTNIQLPSNSAIFGGVSKLNFVGNDFYRNILEAKKLKKQGSLLSIGEERPESEVGPLDIDLHFMRSGSGRVVLPIATLQPPFFHRNAPSFANFGGIGAIAAQKLIYEIELASPEYGLRSKNDKWSRCVLSQLSKYKFPTIEEMYLPILVSEYLPFYEGVNIVLGAYNQWMKTEDSAKVVTIQAGTRILGPIQSFFLAYAQSSCAEIPAHISDNPKEHSEYFLGLMKVVEPLANLGAFSNAFQCPLGSNMNRETKCNYFDDEQ